VCSGRRHVHTGSIVVPGDLGPPDHRWLEFLWEVGEMSVRGENVRARVIF
jgi:hypothetical protein